MKKKFFTYRSFFYPLLFLFLLSFPLDQGEANPPALSTENNPGYVSGEVIVSFTPLSPRSGELSLSSSFSAQTVQAFSGMSFLASEGLPSGTYRAQTRPGESVEEALTRLSETPGIAHVQPNYIYSALLTPNDPSLGSQWGLTKIKAEQAWNITRGDTSILIAVLDTGCDTDHPDLASRLVIIPESDFVNSDSDPNDDNGHGTEAAGAAAAVTDNGVGVAAPAWFARVLPLKVLDVFGNGTTNTIAAAINKAVTNNADIISMSFGAPNVSDPILDAAMANAVAAGIPLFAASGNGGTQNVYYPASSPHCIAVGASAADDSRSSFSSYGTNLDLVAPGSGVLLPTIGGGYTSTNGTSFSCPLAAGAAAVLRAQNPALTPDQIRQRLRFSADDVMSTGFDVFTGYGRLNFQTLLALEAATAGYTADSVTLVLDTGEGSVLGEAASIAYSTGYGGGLAPRLSNAASSVLYADTNFNTAAGTIELYIKPAGFAGVAEDTQYILTQQGQTVTPGNGNFSLMLNRNMTLILQLFDGAGFRTIKANPYGAGLNPSQWYHVAVSYGPIFGLRLFVNGKLEGSNAYAGAIAGDSIYVGAPAGAGQSFAGSYDRLRAASIERSVFPAALAVNHVAPASDTSALVSQNYPLRWSAFQTGGGAITLSVYAASDTSSGPTGVLLASNLTNDGAEDISLSPLSVGSTYHLALVGSNGTDTAMSFASGTLYIFQAQQGGGGGAPAPSAPVVSSSGGGGGCFVATAAFGDYDAPSVKLLRRFRDQILLASRTGRSLAVLYYDLSPSAAQWIAQSPARRAASLILLLPMVAAAGMILLLIKLLPEILFLFPVLCALSRRKR